MDERGNLLPQRITAEEDDAPWEGIDKKLFEQRFREFWASDAQIAKAAQMSPLSVVQELRRRYPDQVVAEDGSCPGDVPTAKMPPKKAKVEQINAVSPVAVAVDLKNAPTAELKKTLFANVKTMRELDAKIEQEHNQDIQHPDWVCRRKLSTECAQLRAELERRNYK